MAPLGHHAQGDGDDKYRWHGRGRAQAGSGGQPGGRGAASDDHLLTTLARYHPLWGADEVVLSTRPSGWRAISLEPPVGGPIDTDTADAFVALVARIVTALTRPSVRPTRLSWPDQHSERRADLASSARWGADRAALEFAPRELAAPIALADPALATVLSHLAERELANQGNDWERRVRAEIRTELSRSPSLQLVAGHLAQSPRTLQQRLSSNGTSYAELLDDERRLLALTLLRDDQLTISAIAARTGYRSPEGFSRAVRRWTGQSPTRWRASAR